jgi:AcrR family transcriptional regulator
MPLSRRNENKRRTTNILRDAAFELFLANGYDATTTDQIAAKAGVSTRTFFRYFETKDEVLFRGQRFWSESTADLIRKQPDDLSPMDAMCETLVHLAKGVSREALVRFERIIATSVALRGRQVIQQVENSGLIAEGLAARQGLAEPDGECRIMASLALMLYQQAAADLRLSRRSVALGALIREKFATLETVYAKVLHGRSVGAT